MGGGIRRLMAFLFLAFLAWPLCGQPLYGRLYDRLLELESRGRYEEALRLIPQIYQAEIPVDAFYTTLAGKKAEILDIVRGHKEKVTNLERIKRELAEWEAAVRKIHGL